MQNLTNTIFPSLLAEQLTKKLESVTNYFQCVIVLIIQGKGTTRNKRSKKHVSLLDRARYNEMIDFHFFNSKKLREF